MTCITITFGDCSENHIGMKKNGSISEIGYTSNDLDMITNFTLPSVDYKSILSQGYIKYGKYS